MSPKAKKILYWVIVGILVAVIVFSISQIAYKLITDAKNEKMYEDLRELAHANQPPRPPVTGNNEPYIPPEEPDEPAGEKKMIYGDIYELNNDTVGWIQIPGTAIDYPVVQTPDKPDYYLRRNFYKKKATCGTIYVRETCDVNKPSDNLTIYGHNMHNGTMFADLLKYKKKSFWEKQRYFYFDTLYEYRTYEIFAVFVTTADKEGFKYHIFDDAGSSTAYENFVKTCKALSLYDTGITPQYGEKLVCLSTCDKSITDGRLVVVGRWVG